MTCIKTTVWILGDQLSPRWPQWLAQSGCDKADTRILLIESQAKLRSRPWHRHKLVLVLAAMRHFAEALQADGWQVDYRQAVDFAHGLAEHERDWQPAGWRVMQPSTWQGAQFVNRLLSARAGFELLPNAMFLGKPDDIGIAKSPQMESFYRKMRVCTGFLMRDGAPIGGIWNHDADNRQPPSPAWRAGRYNDIPTLPVYAPDAITQSVIGEVAAIDGAWGEVDGFTLPVTRADALRFLDAFVRERLPRFGPYEDAMVSDQPTLFHSLLSPLLNIGLLERDEVCRAAEHAYDNGTAPLASVEGFIRQIIGWREFVYACYWREMPGLRDANALDAQRTLPPTYWHPQKTDMHCVRQSADSVYQRGYSHHIQRLMILCNLALIAGISPQSVNEWFLAAYIDAYDWVVTPNVIGMGLYADGGVVGTKPYAGGANYVNKMSTYCRSCRFDPKQRTGPDACPLNALYWDFIARHEARFAKNPRMSMPVRALRTFDADERDRIRQQAALSINKLIAGTL